MVRAHYGLHYVLKEECLRITAPISRGQRVNMREGPYYVAAFNLQNSAELAQLDELALDN